MNNVSRNFGEIGNREVLTIRRGKEDDNGGTCMCLDDKTYEVMYTNLT